MGRDISVGVNDVACEWEKAWMGVNNVACEWEKAWFGDENSKARLFYSDLKKAVLFASCRVGNSSVWTHNTRTTEDVVNWGDMATVQGSRRTLDKFMSITPAFDKLFMSEAGKLVYTEDDGVNWVNTSIAYTDSYRMKVLNDKLCFFNSNGFNLLDSNMTLNTKSISNTFSSYRYLDMIYYNGYYYCLQRYVGSNENVYLYRASESETTMTRKTNCNSGQTVRAVSVNVVGGVMVIIVDRGSSTTNMFREVYTYDGTTMTRQLYTTGFAHYSAGYVYMSDDNTVNTLHVGANKQVLLNTYTVTDGTITQTVTNSVIATLPFDAVYYPSVTYVDGNLVCIYRDVEYPASDASSGYQANLWGAVYKNGQWTTQKVIELSANEEVYNPLKYSFYNGGEPDGYFYMPHNYEAVQQ